MKITKLKTMATLTVFSFAVLVAGNLKAQYCVVPGSPIICFQQNPGGWSSGTTSTQCDFGGITATFYNGTWQPQATFYAPETASGPTGANGDTDGPDQSYDTKVYTTVNCSESITTVVVPLYNCNGYVPDDTTCPGG